MFINSQQLCPSFPLWHLQLKHLSPTFRLRHRQREAVADFLRPQLIEQTALGLFPPTVSVALRQSRLSSLVCWRGCSSSSTSSAWSCPGSHPGPRGAECACLPSCCWSRHRRLLLLTDRSIVLAHASSPVPRFSHRFHQRPGRASKSTCRGG